MNLKTYIIDPAKWQVVPKVATPEMEKELKTPYLNQYDWFCVLNQAPEPPEQQSTEPAGYTYTHERSGHITFYAPGQCPSDDEGYVVEPVYRHPPAQQPMTWDEIQEAFDIPLMSPNMEPMVYTIRQVEQFHGIGKGE